MDWQSDGNSFSLEVDFKPVADGFQAGGLYWLTVQHIYNVSTAPASTSLETWHKHMGHTVCSKRGLIINNSPEETGICHGCELGKSHCLPFPPSNKRASQPLELVYSDLVGPRQSNSIQGNKYFATFIDDYTRVAVVVPLKSKDQLSGAFVHYWQWAERQMEHYKLKCIHFDRGGEYVNKQVKDLLLEAGIEHKLTVPHSPQQNGRAERFNRTIMEKGTSMLHNAGLSLGFWKQAVMTCQGPSHGQSYMDEGTSHIRIRLPPRIVSGDCLTNCLVFLGLLIDHMRMI